MLEACRPGLLRVEAEFNSTFTIDNKPTLSDGLHYVQLKDDGAGEDKQAGDWVFSSGKIRTRPHYPLSPHEGISDLAKTGVADFRMVYSDGSVRVRRVVDLFVLNESTRILQPSLRSASAQTTPHVINMRDQFSPAARVLRGINGEQDMRGLVNQLYMLAPGTDPYHFLIMTNNRQIYVAPDSPPANGIAGTMRVLRNDFSGVGMSAHHETDVSRLFGSQGNLRGLAFAREPLDALTAFHEVNHWVAAYLNRILRLTRTDHHWEAANSAGGLVGGSTWISNPDGTFTSLGYSHQFLKMSRLEQYLWGWIRPDQLPPIPVALDQNQNFGEPGTIIRGPFKIVTAQDIIAIHGPRVPGPEAALHDLKMGYVYTTTGRLATPVEMTARDLLAQRLSTLWSVATDGLSTMEFVTPPSPGPVIVEPFAGKTLDGLGTTLKFTPPEGTTQYHVQVTPFNNDGPAINMIIGAREMVQSGMFTVPAPEYGRGNYIMLPGMGYKWRVRVSSSNTAIGENDPSWSAWSEDKFRTRDASSGTIKLSNGDNNISQHSVATTAIRWENSDPNIFYYEVQVSEDPTFNTNPDTATAAVYWNLVHGGITNNSWTAPEGALRPGATYYWRVRPRQQGDAKQLAWTPVASFTNPLVNASTQEVKPLSGVYRDSIEEALMSGENRYGLLRDKPTPDAVITGEGFVTIVYNPQKEKLRLTMDYSWEPKEFAAAR